MEVVVQKPQINIAPHLLYYSGQVDMDKHCVGVLLLIVISWNGKLIEGLTLLILINAFRISFSGATLSTRIRFLRSGSSE